MADDVSKGLVLKFTADVLPAQRSIQGFAQVAGGSMLALGAQAGAASNSLNDLAGKATALQGFAERLPVIGGLIGKGLGLVAGLAGEAQREIAGLIALSAQADKAGVGTTFFQAYTAQANEMGAAVGDLVKELEKANEAGKVSLGKVGDDDHGRSDALKQLLLHQKAGNVSEDDVAAFKGADSTEARIRVMLDLLDKLDQKGAKLAEYDLANKFFGSSFEERLRAGQDAIGDMRASFDKLATSGGVNIVPAEQIAHAKAIKAEIDELNARLATITAPTVQKIDNIFQNIDEVLVASEAVIVHYIERLQEIVQKWLGAGHAVEWFNTKILEAANYMRSLAGIDPLKIENGAIDAADPTGSKLAEAKAALNRKMGGAQPLPPARPDGLDTSNPYGDLSGVSRPVTVQRKPADTSAALPEDKKSAKKDSDVRTPMEAYIDELVKTAAAEQASADTLGLGNAEKQRAVDLAKASALAKRDDREMTQQERKDVIAAADAYSSARLKIDEFNRSQEQAKERAEYFGQALEGAVEKMAIGGGKLRDVMLDVVKSLEQAALKALILGQGPLAGLFGTSPNLGATGGYGVGGIVGLAGGLFGTGSAGAAGGAASGLGGLASLSKLLGFAGLFADGGNIPAGMFGIAGERGPEIIHGPATVTPQAAIDRAMGSFGGGGGSFTHAPTYNMTAAPGVSPEQLAAVLDKHDRDLNRTFGDKMSNWNRRFQR